MEVSGTHPGLRAGWVVTVLCAALMTACSGPANVEPPEPISDETVDAHIRYLSSDALNGRDAFSEDISVAEDYIAEQFRTAGLSEFAEFPGFKNQFSYEYRPRRNPDAVPTTYQLQNIVGYIEGTDPVLREEYILFGAHHDAITRY